MWIAENWKDYKLLDTSDGERLEKWGDYILVRPDPQVIWKGERKNPLWKKAHTARISPHPHRKDRHTDRLHPPDGIFADKDALF